MRPIDADALKAEYIVTSTTTNSICHLYVSVEDINSAPTIDPVKEKDFVDELINYIFEYPDDDYMTIETLCRKLYKHGLINKKDGEWTCNYIEQADTPQTDYPTEWCEHCELWREDNCIGVAQCKQTAKELKELLSEVDTPQTEEEFEEPNYYDPALWK